MTRDDYFDMLDVPHAIRRQQIAWEQRHTLLRLWRIKGMTLRQLQPIREKMGHAGRSAGRIHQICTRAARDERQPGFKHGSPFERWLVQQTSPRTLYDELQRVLDPRPKPKPKPKPRPRDRVRRLPPEWLTTWLKLPKIVDLPMNVPLPEGWTSGQGQIAFVPITNTTVFRVMCTTPWGERYCDLIIDHAWDGDTRPLFRQAIDELVTLKG